MARLAGALARIADPVERIPIVLLTGFLGSGKTSLLRRAIGGALGADIVVLVNELGAVGLDHHLLWNVAGSVMVLENGCVCCTVRDDLVAQLEALFWRRLRRQMPRFARVVIETTGLADPRHVAAALADSQIVDERYRLEAVVTTVDATAAGAQARRHPEWGAQVGLADLVVLTKTDLATGDEVAAARAAVASVNPIAEIMVAAAVDGPRLRAPRPRARVLPPRGRLVAEHVSLVGTRTIRVGELAPEAVLASLARLCASLGEALLRVKGLVVAPGGAVVAYQVVGNRVAGPEPVALAAPDGGGWLVVITLGVDAAVVGEAVAAAGL